MLSVSDFAAFFAACNEGNGPFTWQVRLLDHLLATASWPEQIAAPTGAGKSNVVDVHVFANALAASGGSRVPRRLSTVVDRRALVDSQFLRAKRILKLLESAQDGVLLDVARALRNLNPVNNSILQVVNLRGGLGAEEHGQRSAWLDDPVSCTVLAATPDMWGSRLLLRGYGSTPYARPREAGLLALDSAVIVDEAHLSQQMLATARRVASLVRGEAERLGVPPLQVVETTATPATHGGSCIEVTAEDLQTDSLLAKRLLRPKHGVIVPAVEWPARGSVKGRHVAQVVAEVEAARSDVQGALVGCIVNRVATATAVAEKLQASGLRVECWVGRKRQYDVDEILASHPDLMDSQLEQSLDVLIATQTVEVGVDLDVAAMVTELAPASALAQRVGRLNRRGLRTSSQVRVLVPEAERLTDCPPYASTDLERAREWLKEASVSAGGLSPWGLRATPPPVAGLRRGFVKVPEVFDGYRWAMTSSRSFADETIELWIREDLEAEVEPCAVVLRAPLPEDPNDATALIMATPPTAREAFPLSISEARELQQRVTAGDAGPDERVWLARGGEDIRALDTDDALAPGDTLIMAASCAVTVQGVATSKAKTSEDVATFWGDAERVLVRGHGGDDLLLRTLADTPEGATEQLRTTLGRDDIQVILPTHHLDEEIPPWAVIMSERIVDDEEIQRWSPAEHPVLLGDHSRAVAERAGTFARALGMAAQLESALVAAGEWHDAGKADPRFQAALGGADHDCLAKSQFESVQESRRAWRLSGLPRGWRHEFRSVLCAWPELVGCADRELICRLVGTSHGRGRSVPEHGSDLVGTSDPPQLRELNEELFVLGGWDDLVARTDRAWGTWGMSFLEALLRSADCSVSKEGK